MSGDLDSPSTQIFVQDLHLPPLRSLDDFVLSSARFQLPTFNDWDRWNNRVLKNLMYYQTNYFLMFAAIYTIMTVMNPIKIFCGLLVQAKLILIVLHFFSNKTTNSVHARHSADSQQKWYFLAGSAVFGFMLLHWFDAFLFTLLTLLLPFSLTFIHASLRLRNIRNKLANTIESLGPSTPMGVFLDVMNITVENIFT